MTVSILVLFAHYSDPRLIRANRADRDKAVRDDIVSIFFDPFLDHQRAYVFASTRTACSPTR